MRQALTHRSIAFCLTPSDLRMLGKNQVAYVREYEVKGQLAFVLHGADGTALAVQKDAAAVWHSAQSNDLEIVAVH
jgi:hypothetical protein